MEKRIGQLDGVRALAITAVLIHHAFKVKLLWMGVDLFFILSGFLITGILINSKSKNLKTYFSHFYQRRARRILPPYLLLLLLTSILFGVAWASHWYLYLFLMNFLVAFRIPHPESLGILWSLAVEEQFYLLWPIVVYLLSETALAWVSAAIILAVPLLRWFCTPLFQSSFVIYALTPFRMDLLATGAILAILWRRYPARFRQLAAYGPILSVLALAALYLFSRTPNFTTTSNTRLSNLWIYELSLITCTGIILWALGGKGVAPLTLAPVRYLGRISYTVYLVHLTFLLVAASHLHGTINIAAAALAATLIYAATSWVFIERPLLTAKSVPLSPSAAEKV